MSRVGKGHRASKYAKSGKYNSQFYRTTEKAGKWRGKDKDSYTKYTKSRKEKHDETTKEYFERLKKK